MTRLVRLAVVAACLLTPALIAEKGPKAKEPYALIVGTVYDADQRAAPGVKIKFRRSDQKKAAWERISDRRGEFALRVFPGPADYVVWADLKDKQAAEKTAIKVHIEKDERQDVVLHLREKHNRP